MPDELELKIVSLQNQIDELSARFSKYDFSNSKIEVKEVVQKTAGYQSENFVTGVSGWRLEASGDLEANNGNFRGDITGASGSFTGFISASGGTIGGFAIGSDYIRDSGNSFGLCSFISGGDDIRFWAGDTYANRASAPFRVTEGGNGYFSGDIYVSKINMTGGTFINTAATLAEARLNTLFKKTVFIGAYNDGMTATGDTITRSVVVTALTSAPNWTSLKSTGVGGGCFTKDSEFICQTIVDQTTNQDAFWGVGTSGGGNPQPLNGALTGDHYGFIIDDATIYASNADGTTQTRTDISGSVTFTNYNTYRIVFDAGTSVSFYVNDILVATHTTNLPDAPDGSGVVIFIGIDSTSGSKSMTLTNNYTFIHSTV